VRSRWARFSRARRRLLDWGEEGVEGGVEPLDDLSELALVPGGVGADRELAGSGAVGERAAVGDEGLQGIDAAVQGLLGPVEVTLVVVGDGRGDVALRDPLHVVAALAERLREGVKRLPERTSGLSIRMESMFGCGARVTQESGAGPGREYPVQQRHRPPLASQVHAVRSPPGCRRPSLGDT
jgi:hypothetical protein